MSKGGFSCEQSVEFEIGSDASRNRLKIDVALGDVVSLELPENVELAGEPALGNRAIFDVKVISSPLRVLVWPMLPKGASDVDPASLRGARSNLQIFLDSGVTILIELRIGRPGRSVQRVRFSFPERDEESAYVRERISEETRRLQAEYEGRRAALEQRIGEATRERLAEGMLDQAECTSLRGRVMRDLVVVRTHRLCRIGNDVLLAFSVQNRSRDSFSIERVEVRSGASEGDALEAQTTYGGQTFLVFDQRVRGVVAWTVDEDGEDVAEWTVSVLEKSGGQRVVELGGIGF